MDSLLSIYFQHNARTHTLHDPVAHKKAEVGRFVLKGEHPTVSRLYRLPWILTDALLPSALVSTAAYLVHLTLELGDGLVKVVPANLVVSCNLAILAPVHLVRRER